MFPELWQVQHSKRRVRRSGFVHEHHTSLRNGVNSSAAWWWRVAWTLALGIQAEVIGFRACARTRKAIMRVSTITDAEAAARTTMNARRNGRRSESLMVLPVTAVISSVLLDVHRDHKDY